MESWTSALPVGSKYINYNYSYPRATRGAGIGGVNDQSDNEEGETEVSY